MSEFIILPNIIWPIEPVILSSIRKQTSSILTFLGMKWKLNLIYVQDTSKGNSIQLMLQRLSINLNSVRLELSASTSVTSATRSPYYQKDVKFDTRYQECCIWNENIQNVDKYIKDPVTFCISISPVAGVSREIIENANKKHEAVGIPACVMSLKEDIGKLFESQEYADVVLQCGDRQIPAHRAILSCRSEVFAAMFRNDMKESREGIVHVIDMEASVLEQLIRYLYTGQLTDLSTNSTYMLHSAAEKYAVESLKMKTSVLAIDKFLTKSKSLSTEPQDVESGQKLEEGDSKEKKLLEQLFLSSEWQILAEECPRLASAMCAPLIINGVLED